MTLMNSLLAAGARVPEWTVQDRLVKARTSAGYEQAEFATATGISRATISACENGKRPASKATLNLWALATGVPIEWLVSGKYTPRDLNPEPTDLGGKVSPIRRVRVTSARRREKVS